MGEAGFILAKDSGSGTVLTFSAVAPDMAFLRPALGGTESAAVPAMTEVVTTKLEAAPKFATTATRVAGWSESLVKLASGGGVERLVVSHGPS